MTDVLQRVLLAVVDVDVLGDDLGRRSRRPRCSKLSVGTFEHLCSMGHQLLDYQRRSKRRRRMTATRFMQIRNASRMSVAPEVRSTKPRSAAVAHM